MRAAIVLAIMIGGPLSAHAGNGNDVGVVAAGDSTLLSVASAQITTWLSQHGRVAVATSIPSSAITGMLECFALGHSDCGHDIVDTQAKASTIVYARIVEKRRTRDVILTLYRLDKGRAALAEGGTCERCTSASLRAAVDDIMARLMRPAAAAVGHIKLRSSPSGARITVDGKQVGVTPLDWDMTTGKHMLGMELDKHQAQQRTLNVSSDQDEVVDLSLVEIPTNAVRREGTDLSRSRVWPVAAMGVGAAAIIIGGVLIAVDQEPGQLAPPSVHNSAPIGVGVSLAGAACAGVGAYLWFRAAETSSSPVAVVTGDTAYLGWLGRF
jgi:hypothetical protein